MGGDITAEINYLTNTTDGAPAWLKSMATIGYVAKNYGHEPTSVTMHDLRDKENTVNLDTNALEVIKYDGSMQDKFEDGSEEQRVHYEEMADIIKKHLGASRVVFYHYVFRTRGALLPREECSDHQRNPGFLVHSDIDGSGTQHKIKELLGEEEGEKLMQKRYASLNTWRPLGSNPITDKPLAICDYQSVDVEKDIHSLEIRGSTNTSTATTISPSTDDAHQWYYISEMKSNEMFIFKMFDSKADVAQTAYHTAFINKHVPSSTVEQKSLEMRCLVFYD